MPPCTTSKKSAFLWSRLKCGDIDALDSLYDIYVDALYRFGMTCTKDNGHVKDCIHDLFLDIYKYRKKLSDVEHVRHYLFTSLKRKINKKYSTKVNLFASTEQEQLLSAVDGSIEDILIDKENSRAIYNKLNKALSFLSQKQREGIDLKFRKKKSYEEISTILGISIESVRTLIYRAIKKLRSDMELN